VTKAFDYAHENAGRFREELYELLRIPSVSADPAFSGEVRKAAYWLMEHFEMLGFEAELIETEGQHPMVYAEWMKAGEGAKTVLIYGHYDVQPAVMEDGWDTDPFEPVEKDGFMFARGSTDDKGQVFAHIKAVEALLKTEGKLPVNVKFIIEGEEESGGEAIAQYVKSEEGKRLKADACVISDSSMLEIGQPIIVNALRGGIVFDLIVKGPKQDLHSGMYGGTVHNPLQALAEILAQLHKLDGSVAVTGFYDNVRLLSEKEREEIAAIKWEREEWEEATGAPKPWGELSYTLLERIGARPTLEITGMAGGYFGEGFKSIVPAKAWAKISCRLVADQEPQEIFEKVSNYIRKIAPTTVTIEMRKERMGSEAALVNTNTPAMQAAIRAFEKAWGKAPIFKREGGSIPIVSDFQNRLGMPVILMGFGLDSDNLHGPNEHFSIEMFHKGVDTSIQFLIEMAE
jgi:acetylornithine deacetylase/succinyl-diaminopimelate desuccinylase-like protein